MIFQYLRTFSYICIILDNSVAVSITSALDNIDLEEETPIANTSSVSPKEFPVDDAGEGTNDQAEDQQQLSSPLTIQAPYSNSPLHLTQLALAEQHIYRDLLAYENHLQERLQILQRLRTDYESSVLAAQQQILRSDLMDDWSKAGVVSSHPFLAYRMIRRFSTDFQAFTQHIWQSLENELWETLESRRAKFAWPSHDDLLRFTNALIRIQDTYDFDIDQFTDGAIKDHHLRVGLTARQCLDISEAALQSGEINSATEWFQAAHSKAIGDQDNSVSLNDLTQAWEKTFQEFQRIWPMQIFTTHDVFKEAKQLLRNDFDRIKKNLTKEHASVNFRALCRGDNMLKRAQISDLKCYLENSKLPYYIISPLKIEMYSWQPLVYKVHEFLTPHAIGNLSFTVVPAMASLVDNGASLLHEQSTDKTYTHFLIPDKASPYLTALTKKIDLLPGLNIFQLYTVPNDNYLVSTFAVGNHYQPCSACFKDVANALTNKYDDKTISTVHIVLHEPQKGGELAFPLLGVLIPATIGSAIVHNDYNLFGNTDERTMHGACPVLIGEKWVATKLIHEEVLKDQENVITEES